MAQRPCCRACRHCVSRPAGADAMAGAERWCRLRQLPIHGALAGELWCHHWTAREPRLPTLAPASRLRLAAGAAT